MRMLSLRARLTLWYTLALLVVLCLFGADVLWQQRRIGVRRVDRELEAFTATLANVVGDELTEIADPRSAAQEARNTVTTPGRAVAILDARGDDARAARRQPAVGGGPRTARGAGGDARRDSNRAVPRRDRRVVAGLGRITAHHRHGAASRRDSIDGPRGSRAP